MTGAYVSVGGVGDGFVATNPLLLRNQWMPRHFDRRETTKQQRS